MINKQLIKQRFEKNFTTYSQNAIVQKHMANVLIDNFLKINEKQKILNKILEIGCGTGIFTRKIKQKLNFEALFLNDIIQNSQQMDNTTFILGDCEKIDLPKELDLIISNASLQWLENPKDFFKKACNSLSINAILAFSTFEEGNLFEIKEITGKSLNYYKKSELKNILSENFKVLFSTTEEIILEFNSVNDVLKHLKLTGVNALTTKNWTKKDLKEFKEKYEAKFKCKNDKLKLTYRPMYFICAKLK